MSWQARGLFRELLDESWEDGCLPAEVEVLADICNCPVDEFRKYWPEIKPAWKVTPEGLVNRKLEEQRTEMDTLRIINANNGRAGGRKKLANANERHIGEQSKEEQSKAVSNAPRSHPKASLVGKRALSREKAIYELYPRKVGSIAAMREITKAVKRLMKGGTTPALSEEAAWKFLEDAVREYATSPAGTDPIRAHIPYPSTWFNAGRYLDDRSEWRIQGDTDFGTERPYSPWSSTKASLGIEARTIAEIDADDDVRPQNEGRRQQKLIPYRGLRETDPHEYANAPQWVRDDLESEQAGPRLKGRG